MAQELARRVCAEVLKGLDPDVLEYITGCVMDDDKLLEKEVCPRVLVLWCLGVTCDSASLHAVMLMG